MEKSAARNSTRSQIRSDSNLFATKTKTIPAANRLHAIVNILRRAIRRWKTPAVGVVAERSKDPYQILISCLLSLRTKDQVTHEASEKLFRLATTPQEMIRLSRETIRRAIYPVGFYKTKAETVRRVSQDLLVRFDGKVPDTLEALLSLKGVGRKTANLVVTLGFHKPGICVDTHVHRISNRLGLVRTKTPEKTEMALRRHLPPRYWIEWNDLLVTFGQNLCKPISPLCSQCPIDRYCPRIGVTHHR